MRRMAVDIFRHVPIAKCDYLHGSFDTPVKDAHIGSLSSSFPMLKMIGEPSC